jgi:hypothetical protein
VRPSVGRIVHYVNLGDKDGKYPPQVQAAVITGIYRATPNGVERVNDGVGEPGDDILRAVDLKVFYKTGLFDCEGIPQKTETDQRGCWEWPRMAPTSPKENGDAVPV